LTTGLSRKGSGFVDGAVGEEGLPPVYARDAGIGGAWSVDDASGDFTGYWVTRDGRERLWAGWVRMRVSAGEEDLGTPTGGL
jgi:hypothetical protein